MNLLYFTEGKIQSLETNFYTPRLMRRQLVLQILLGSVFTGLLLLLADQQQGSWNSSMDLCPPSQKAPTKDPLDHSSRKFEWLTQTPHPFDLRYPYPYPFLINHPDKCEGPRGAPFLLMLVMTRPQDVGVRQAIRQTWGNETLVPSVVVRRLFVLGLPPPLFDKELQALLEEEDREHGDLLQVGFLDTYRNLTLKVLMGLEWMAQHCPSAKYVLKVDSDVFLNPNFLIQHILQHNGPPRPNFITGHIYRNPNPERRQGLKWYMPPELYSQSKYPDYCAGPGYVLSGSLALRVLSVAQRVKAIYLEDVFVGFCLKHLGVKPVPAPPRTFLMVRRKYNHCAFQRLVLVHHFQHQELLHIWPDFLRANNTC
ncbi:beta-1,3-galactosyltransferase 2-like [Monodelphis domestica]|uniref:Hexosyltransferase n=1 Tax=Monodelphis domestica TaxID=13616 RepID=K7E0Y3_MONDO|nr:beta-1,3-galactosyltransferase 2-like [Monodelphis domestica]